MACRLHVSLQMPHLMHLAASIRWGFFFSPAIALLGQAFAQAPHPLHLSSRIE
jgi:hypothetical protein